MTAPLPSAPPRPERLPFGPPFLIADPAAARRDLTLLRRALAASGVVAEATVARPLERDLVIQRHVQLSGLRSPRWNQRGS